MEKDSIDFVVTWVDGSDVNWQKEKAKYEGKEFDTALNFDARYRENDLLRYWFRCVEKNAPWVNRIHFVTCGHLPAWLNVDNPKLHIVKHEDYIPEECLPTFNSNSIELAMHRIPELSEKFVYFNDDMFLIAPSSPDLFFDGDVPRDQYKVRVLYRQNNNDNIDYLKFNNLGVINSHFFGRAKKRGVILKMLSKQHSFKDVLRNIWSLAFNGYIGFWDPHVSIPYLKSDFEKVWAQEEDLLNATMKNRFRSPYDITHWVFRYWRLAEGAFSPMDYATVSARFNVCSKNIAKAVKYIKRQKVNIVCLNDSSYNNIVEKANRRLKKAFDTILPDRSSFEIDADDGEVCKPDAE